MLNKTIFFSFPINFLLAFRRADDFLNFKYENEPPTESIKNKNNIIIATSFIEALFRCL